MNNWQIFTFSASDGLQLSGRKYGWEHCERTAVVCLAGLDRNSSDFHEVAEHLSHGENPRRVLTLDYRGRGESQHDKNHENYNIIQEAEDVIQGVTAAGLGHINILANSRGGLIAMLLSAMRPGIINSVILNDIGPQIEGAGLMRIKRCMEKTSDHSNWASASQFLEEIGRNHFKNMGSDYWNNHARKIFKSHDDKIIRNYDPKLLNTISAIDIDTRLPDMWKQFVGLTKIPLFLLHGEKSDFLSNETVLKMQETHTNMKLINVADQGHTPDLSTGNLPQEIDHFFASNDH